MFSVLPLVFLHIWAIILVIRMTIWAFMMISPIILIILDLFTSLSPYSSTEVLLLVLDRSFFIGRLQKHVPAVESYPARSEDDNAACMLPT